MERLSRGRGLSQQLFVLLMESPGLLKQPQGLRTHIDATHAHHTLEHHHLNTLEPRPRRGAVTRCTSPGVVLMAPGGEAPHPDHPPTAPTTDNLSAAAPPAPLQRRRDGCRHPQAHCSPLHPQLSRHHSRDASGVLAVLLVPAGAANTRTEVNYPGTAGFTTDARAHRRSCRQRPHVSNMTRVQIDASCLLPPSSFPQAHNTTPWRTLRSSCHTAVASRCGAPGQR
jgi:hypothetical protein